MALIGKALISSLGLWTNWLTTTESCLKEAIAQRDFVAMVIDVVLKIRATQQIIQSDQ